MPPPETPDSEYFKSREKKSKLKIPPETVMLPALLASARPFMLPCHRDLNGYRHFSLIYAANTCKNFITST